MHCAIGNDADNDHTDCIDPSHGSSTCCYTCCAVCQDECFDPEIFGICDECGKPYHLASHLDHNPETGVHYECETGWYRIDLTGAMKNEIEQVLLDILYNDEYSVDYNQVALMDALNIIENAERRVLDKF